MPQIIVWEWRIIFSENLLHKISYPVKDPCSYQVIWYLTSIANYRSLVTGCLMVAALSTDFLSMTSSSSPWSVVTNLSISIIPLRSFFLSDRKFTRSVQSLNIPYGQSSAKLPVIQCPVTWVTRVIQSLGSSSHSGHFDDWVMIKSSLLSPIF